MIDQCIYLWFKQKRMKGELDSAPLLCEKAVDLSKRILKQVMDGSGDFVKGMAFGSLVA